jgi:glycopeptide antibiotics resistance protein
MNSCHGPQLRFSFSDVGVVAFTAIGAQFLGVVFRLLRARGALQHKALTTKLAVDILVAFCYRFR